MDKLERINFAIYDAAKTFKGGFSALAEEMRCRHQTLINKLNPQDENSELKVSELVDLMETCNTTEPLEAIVDHFECKLVTRTQSRAETLMEGVLAATSEHGDVTRAINDALADGVITGKELNLILKEISEAERALVALKNTLQGKNVV